MQQTKLTQKFTWKTQNGRTTSWAWSLEEASLCRNQQKKYKAHDTPDYVDFCHTQLRHIHLLQTQY